MISTHCDDTGQLGGRPALRGGLRCTIRLLGVLESLSANLADELNDLIDNPDTASSDDPDVFNVVSGQSPAAREKPDHLRRPLLARPVSVSGTGGACPAGPQTGRGPHRGTTGRTVKHAGLCPREGSSGEHRGHSRLSGRGRRELRTAAWRAVWGAQHANPVLAARYAHLTTREHNGLAGQQARAACAATLLRWLHAVVVRRTPWNPEIAAGRRPGAAGAVIRPGVAAA